jgi:hypothetical protein
MRIAGRKMQAARRMMEVDIREKPKAEDGRQNAEYAAGFGNG